jgi:Trk K+ transport system NAD-binding subunit
LRSSGEQVTMLRGKSFLIYGLSRLSVRVSASLVADHAEVTLIAVTGPDDLLRAAVDPAVQLQDAHHGSLAETLARENISTAECALVLADEDLENLRVAVLIRRTAPDTPVVVRAFDPVLADQLEAGLKVRRAYSVSALAAPAFATAAAGHTVLDTLRIGDQETPIVRMPLEAGAPLIGTAISDVKARHKCAVLAYKPSGGEWLPSVSGGDDRIAAGDEVLVGGLLADILRLITDNSRLTAPARTFPRPSRNTRNGYLRFTLLPRLATLLVGILLASIFAFAHALHLRPVDAVYFMVTTATTTGYGDISLRDSPDWLKLFGCVVMLAGGALLGIVFSQLAAIATTDRLDEVMGRKAARMRGHVIVTGLGNLGYRVAKLLRDAGLPVVVLQLKPNARFAAAIRARCPVLTGDARLPEDLARAGVASCSAVIACTNDDLANIQACLHARRVNPGARIVARVFDETLAERMSGAFDIDVALSASTVAAKAFVGAATDERAYRTIRVGELDFLSCRYTLPHAVDAAKIAAWRSSGVRILAWRKPGKPVEPPVAIFPALEAGAELVLCGPPAEVRAITDS